MRLVNEWQLRKRNDTYIFNRIYGCGENDFGVKRFSRELGLTFIDLDWYIEERFHKTVQQLFSERGEQGFPRIGAKMLHEVAEFEDVVISAGGALLVF